MPKVSVMMNCYNGERYLRQALESVTAQSFEDWEIIFWDNASADGTAAIARNYDPRLRYFRSQSTIPLGAARRQAMLQAQGEWVAFLDCDDYWLPHKLERQLKEVEGTSHVLCYAGIVEVNPDGSKIREVLPQCPTGWMLETQLTQFDINMVTPLLRRSALAEFCLSFDDNVTASEEYNLFVRLAARGSFASIAEVLGVWRISPGSLTDRSISKWGEERYYTLDQLKSENPGIEEKYPAAFREAYARGDYYRARYLMSVGQATMARQLMSKIVGDDPRYRLLWLASFWPVFWNFLHSSFLKRVALPKLAGLLWGR